MNRFPNTGIDMVGKVIGKLTVLRMGPPNSQRRYWVCRCECGNEVTVSGQRLRRNERTHCGCAGRRIAGTTPTHADYSTAVQAEAFADLERAWNRIPIQHETQNPRPDHQ